MDFTYFSISVVILIFLIRILFKRDRNNSKDSNPNNYIESAQNIELARNSIEAKNSIVAIIDYPIKKQNSFLNPNDDFGTLNKGVVIDNQTYEYDFKDMY
jgi:hypothetical protein